MAIVRLGDILAVAKAEWDLNTPDTNTPDAYTPDGHTPDGHRPDGQAHSPTKSTTRAADARDAGFLAEFYSQSRLHHISSMAARAKQYVTGLRDRGGAAFPARWAVQTEDGICGCEES